MPRPKNPTPPQKGHRSSRPMPMKTRGVYANVKLQPVPFDWEVDCPPYCCFNCRVYDEHLNKDCPSPATHQYCINCGRRGILVFGCPRCGKGYIEEFIPRYAERYEAQQSTVEVPKQAERKLPVGMTLPPKPVRTRKSNSLSFSSPQVSPDKNLLFDESFSAASNSFMASEIRDEVIHAVIDPVIAVQNSNVTSSFVVATETMDEHIHADDDEDLEEIIFDEDFDDILVDEDEMPSVEQPQTSIAVQFIRLVDMMKHLPIKTQNMVVEQFAEHQKVFAGQS